MHITVCLTDLRPDPWVQQLRAALPDAQVSAWTPGAPQADHAVVWAPPQRFIDEQPGLQSLFNIGAGVDALLQLRLPERMRIVRLDDAGMGVQMAEYVCHALIRHFREFDGYEADAREGQWTFRKPRNRRDFAVGIMGLGVLGQRVARAVAGFEFPLVGWSRTPRQVEGMQCFAGADALDDFLSASRVLVNLLPLTPDTRGILNARSLGRLNRGQPGGYLINVARGAHLVEADLIPMLDRGQLAGATLDVFETEPLPAEHPFWRHPRIQVTPHASARTERDTSVAQIVRKIEALSRGEPIAGVVERTRGY